MYKSFSEFISEVEMAGHEEVTATKPTALSEAMCEKINECMEMAKMEADQWNNDEDDKHTYESYISDCDTYIKEKLNNLKK